MGTAHWVRPSGTELVASGLILTHVAWVVAVLAVRPTEVSGVRGVAAAAGSAATGSAAGCAAGAAASTGRLASGARTEVLFCDGLLQGGELSGEAGQGHLHGLVLPVGFGC